MEIQKAIEIIEKSAHMVFLLPPRPNADILASAEVLMRVLEERGKRVGLPSAAVMGEDAQFFPRLSRNPSLLKEFVVTLDTLRGPVSQLRYEKEGEKVHIIFSPKSLPIQEEFVSFSDGKIQCDSAITLGVSDIEAASDSAGLTPEFATETPFINIDASKENRRFGEANLVNPEKTSIAEIIYELVPLLRGEPLDKESATLLLAGIFAKTQELRSASTGADTLLASSELVRLGADRIRAGEIAGERVDISFMQLVGRASVRSRLEPERKILWSFLTSEDFEKTGRVVTDAPRVLYRIDREFPPHAFSALLAQSPETQKVQALLLGERGILENLAERTEATLSNPHLSLEDKFNDFKDAENFVASLLDGVL